MEKDPISDNEGFFKIPYHDCKDHGQKLNYVCLDPKCHKSSMICSICKDQNHTQHPTKPLKFYLADLRQKYHNTEHESNLNEMLEELEVSQLTFCERLKQAVEKVALNFRQLEERVMSEIQKIRNEIFQEIAKRSRFNEFYENLRRGKIQQGNFIIQNYLPQTSIGKISNFEAIEKLSLSMCKHISSLQQDLICRQTFRQKAVLLEKQQSQQSDNIHVFSLSKSIKVPTNITFVDSVLTQTTQVYVTKSLCIIDFPVSEISGKISFKILKLSKNAVFMISALTKEVYDSMKECWVQVKLKDKASYALGSNGFAFGWTKRLIKQFGQNSTLSLSYKSNQLRIQQKSQYCSSQIPHGTKLYVVLALMGNCQVKVTHKK